MRTESAAHLRRLRVTCQTPILNQLDMHQPQQPLPPRLARTGNCLSSQIAETKKKSKKRNFTKCPKHRSRHFSTRLHDHSLRLRSKLGKLVDEFGLNDAFSVPADCSDVRVPVKSDVTRYCNTFNKCLLVSSVSLLAQQTDLQIYNPKTGTKSNTRADKTVKQRRRLATMTQATNCAVCAARTAMIT